MATAHGAPPSGSDNLAVIRAVLDEWVRGETEITYRVLDDQVTWDARSIPLREFAHVYHGREQVREWWRGWFEAWERVEIMDSPQLHRSGNQVVSWWHQKNLGKWSGAALEQDVGFVWTFENGRIVRVAVFWSRAEAFCAAGLEPPNAPSPP